jgi:hypothetical protein
MPLPARAQAANPPAPSRPQVSTRDRELARQHYLRAEQYFREGAYEASLAAMSEAYRLLGGGVALIVIGGGLGGGAVAAGRSVEAQARTLAGQPFSQALYATQERGKALAAAGAALDVLGALSLAGGAAWTGVWLYQRRPRRAPGTPASDGRPRTALLPAGAGLLVAGTF